MVTGLLHHAQWAVFALILANQAGVPVFAAPALLGVGALAWIGDVNVGLVVIAAVAASLCADLIWYSVGRRRGPWALTMLRRAAVWAGTWIGAGYLIASVTSSRGVSALPLVAVIVAASAVAILGINAYVARAHGAAEPITILRPHALISALAQSLGHDRRRNDLGATTSVNGHDGGECRDSAGGCGEWERGYASESVAHRSALLSRGRDRDGDRDDEDDRAPASRERARACAAP